jgi:hypothetical protein
MPSPNAHEDRRLWSQKARGERFDFPSRFTYYHRPLKAYWRAFRDAGFQVLDFDEPVLQPPYPPDLPPDELQGTLQCAWSVAFHLERPEGQGAGGTGGRA